MREEARPPGLQLKALLQIRSRAIERSVLYKNGDKEENTHTFSYMAVKTKMFIANG